MKRTQALLEKTKDELRNAKKLLDEKKHAEKHANNSHERNTAKIARKMIEKTIGELKEHRDILKEDAAE